MKRFYFKFGIRVDVPKRYRLEDPSGKVLEKEPKEQKCFMFQGSDNPRTTDKPERLGCR